LPRLRLKIIFPKLRACTSFKYPLAIVGIACDIMEKDFMKRIVVNPKVMVGKPVIRGTRIAVYEIINRLSQGQTFKEITEDLEITNDDVKAALIYAGQLVEGEEIFPVIVGSKHEVSR